MGRFRDFVEAVSLAALLRRMEVAESESEEYKTSGYTSTEWSRRLGRRALELTTLDETHDLDGVAELREMAGRHRKDLRRAAREIAGSLTLTERRAFEMLMAASRSGENELRTISDEDRDLYRRLRDLFDLPDPALLEELKALEPGLDQVEKRFAVSSVAWEESDADDEGIVALRVAIEEFIGPNSSATDPLLRTEEVEQLAVYALSRRLGIRSSIDESQLPLSEPFDDPPDI